MNSIIYVYVFNRDDNINDSLMNIGSNHDYLMCSLMKREQRYWDSYSEDNLEYKIEIYIYIDLLI